MQYRTLGRTGIQVGEIGMGCEGYAGKSDAQVKELLDIMEAAGANCLDCYVTDPEIRDKLGRALAGRREKFIIQGHICAAWKDGQYKRTRDLEEVRSSYADLLSRLGTDYIDIGMIHYVDAMADWETVRTGGVMDYALELKKQGVIRCIGLSSHNPEVALAAVESGDIDVLMFSVNPCYDLQPAITVMKAFGGGDLLSDKGPAGKALTPFQCLHYALTRPAVACVMSGARSAEDLKASLAYEDSSPEERDYAAALAAFPKISWKGHCMYCGHCAPCPKAQGEIPETVREHYAALPHKAGECVQCGSCEGRCPFSVGAVENMRQAAELFGA